METRRRYSWTEGLEVGVIGYAVVVVLIAGLDLVLGRPLFYTPGTLGRGMVTDPGPPGTIAAGAVLAFNGLHLLAFLMIGFGVLLLARFVELHPAAWYLAFFGCVAAFFAAELAFAVLDPEGRILTWWSILGATAGAAFAMGLYVNYRHPRLWRRIEGLDGEGDS